jgi:uncharacterized membrane protein
MIMSALLILGFDGMPTADDILNALRQLKRPDLSSLEDACIVQRGADGKVHIKQAVNLTANGSAGARSFWGALVGALFLSPLTGFAVGAPTRTSLSAVARQLPALGISDAFLFGLVETVPPGSSAVCLLLDNTDDGEMLSELRPYRPKVLNTTLSEENRQQLHEAIGGSA